MTPLFYNMVIRMVRTTYRDRRYNMMRSKKVIQNQILGYLMD